MKVKKTVRKALSLLIAVMMLVSLMPPGTVAASAMSGDGSLSNPYLINTADELLAFREKVADGQTSACAKLMNDIAFNTGTSYTADGYSGDEPVEWEPIGATIGTKYEGTFDGNGYYVSGLYSTKGGLFGYLGNATIKNLKIENAFVNTSDNSGLLANESSGTSLNIENCSVAGYAKGTNTGGFIGSCANVTFTDCNSSASVNCSGYAGGFVGSLNGDYSFIRCSRNNTITSSQSYAGGFIGYALESEGSNEIIDCYSTNNVSGYGVAGGFIGKSISDFFMMNCYKTGYIDTNEYESQKTYAGAVVGCLNSCAGIDNFFYSLSGWYEAGIVGNSEESGYEPIYEINCSEVDGNQFASGEVAYKLNGNTSDGDLAWGQTLGVDSTPVLGGKTVYYGTDCAGKTLYSNEPVTADHDFASANGKCTKCGAYEDAMSALYGHSITLDGKIGLNFFMEIDDYYANNSTSMNFSVINYDSETGQQNVLYTQSVPITDDTKVIYDGKTYYKFTCSLAAKEMTCSVKAQLVNGENEGTAFYYSVEQYAYTILNDESYDNTTKELVIAMLNYGSNSQNYFDFNTYYLANYDLPDELTQLADTQAEELSAYASSYTAGESYTGSTSYYGSSLVLNSGTEIKHYFTYDSSNTNIDAFTCKDNDGKSYKIAESGSYLYVKVDSIPAHQLGDALTLSLYENDVKVGDISYSPLSYVYSVLKAYTTDDGTHDNVRNLVKSIYRYYNKSVAYTTRGNAD